MRIDTIAIVGSGIMGSSWAIVYARAGLQVRIFDRNPATRDHVLARIARAIEDSAELVGDAQAQAALNARVSVHDRLESALDGAGLVHECIEEKLESKRAIFELLDQLADPVTILATSTSSFPVSTFASELGGRARCIVIHPATPPHLLPVTEVCPAPFTDERVTAEVFKLMDHCGQIPILIRKELPSFVLNRMQGALLVEMFRCLNQGVISPGDIDKIISHGFGLRWAFLGPFEGVDLNAVGGIREYLERFGFLFDNIALDLGQTEPVVTTEAIAQLESYAREKLPLDAITSRVRWRDQSITALRVLKRERDEAAV